jgi:hypothetical protein
MWDPPIMKIDRRECKQIIERVWIQLIIRLEIKESTEKRKAGNHF